MRLNKKVVLDYWVHILEEVPRLPNLLKKRILCGERSRELTL
jgi:hypothetical protein